MAVILVDYENVHGSNGLKGAEMLRSDDTLIIFYSESCRKIKQEYMRFICESKCQFRIVKLKNTGKNALDFYIAVEYGILYEQGMNDLAIVSNDKGFQAILDYFSMNEAMSDIHIVRAGILESAFLLLDTPENFARREALLQSTTMLDIAEEYVRMEERNCIESRIRDTVRGTNYEDKISEIIDLVEGKGQSGNKSLYTSSLHSFGRTAGTEIYRLVKHIV